MCDCTLPRPKQDKATASPGRRAVLSAGLGLAGALALPASAAVASAAPKTSAPAGRTHAILVGTSGGPIWWAGSRRRGICTVVEVAGRRYMIDAGHGSAPGLRDTGLLGSLGGRNDLSAFKAVFLTHLHSDHVTDLSTFLLQGWIGGGIGAPGQPPLTVYGPGDRGTLPHVFPAGRPAPSVFNPENPTPGTESMVSQLLAAFATDINDRLFDGASPAIETRIRANDIALPAGTPAHEPSGKPPRMSPFLVHEDDVVRVTATLVDHGQMVPSYAYRFDSEDGAIVVSGDTTVSPNLNELAEGADILIHEVLDEAWVRESIAGLPVPEAVKQAYINHMLGAHTTTEQMKTIVAETGVRTLVLHHLVPGELPNQGWTRATQSLQRSVSADVVLGQDGMRVGMNRVIG